MARKRRLWKTFYLDDTEHYHRLKAAMIDTGKYTATFAHGQLETNLPVSELRAYFRLVEIPWQDYVSDTEPRIIPLVDDNALDDDAFLWWYRKSEELTD